MAICDENTRVLTISETGYGRISNIEDYRLQSRGGKGIKAGVFNEKTGYLVNLKPVLLSSVVISFADSKTQSISGR